MNLLDLHKSSVHFDEQSHTYTTADGVALSGVTSIIKQVLFTDKYRGIPDEVLAKAAERGTAIHNECEDINLLGASSLSDFSSMEARNYHRLLEENNITMIASEYLVSDESVVATMIDCIDDQGNLYDIKTTATLDTDSLSWQLSFCDYLFVQQNILLDRPSSRLYGIWLRGDTARIVEVERKTDEEIERVLRVYLNGDTIAPKPTVFSSPEEEALVKISEQEEAIISLKQMLDYHEAKKQESLDLLKEKMEREGSRSSRPLACL